MQICPTCGACFDDVYDFCSFDGEVLQQVFTGNRVLSERYLLEQRLAAGAMGTVFRARHLQIGSTVAVKVMKPKKEEIKVGIARFHREAQILGQIKHPNAVLVMDFGVEERDDTAIPYLVTEFLRGQTLSRYLKEKSILTLEEAERIIGPVCEAVEEAHQAGVIHRDIKPGNIFLEQLRDQSEIVKVLDFGIAKFVELTPQVLERLQHNYVNWSQNYRSVAPVEIKGLADDEVATMTEGLPTVQAAAEEERTITNAGFMVGTLHYMAPEQITGERVSAQTDIYAIATLLFRLLVGRRPFEGDETAIIEAKTRGRQPSLRHAGVEVSDDLEQLITSSFAYDPKLRPKSALEFARAVRQAVPASRTDATQDVPLSLAIQLLAVTRSLEQVHKVLLTFGASSELEESYLQARDRLLSLNRPLARITTLINGLPAELDDEQRQSLAEAAEEFEQSCGPIQSELHSTEMAQGKEFLDYLLVVWTQFYLTIGQQLTSLRSKVGIAQPEPEAVEAPVNPFADDGESEETILERIVENLQAKDDIVSIEAFESLLTKHADILLPALAQGAHETNELLEQLVAGLWSHADTLLLMELFPKNRVVRLLPLLKKMTKVKSGKPFVVLSNIFTEQIPEDDQAKQQIEQAVGVIDDVRQRAVLWRCLMIHPLQQVRTVAADNIKLSEFWNVVIYEQTPLPFLTAVFEKVMSGAPSEYLKIFFLCVRDRLVGVATSEEITHTFQLLYLFFRVPCFHEDVVFEPLLEIDKALRKRCSLANIDVPVDTAYNETVDNFRAEGATETEGLEHMRDIPLPIQRKLAREGHFLYYFISHPNERVARETLRHLLKFDDVTRFLRIPSIHRAVLYELAKIRRFYRELTPRLALLQNPKTTGQIARSYISHLGREQLNLLILNKTINADVRTVAKKHLDRLEQRRS